MCTTNLTFLRIAAPSVAKHDLTPDALITASKEINSARQRQNEYIYAILGCDVAISFSQIPRASISQRRVLFCRWLHRKHKTHNREPSTIGVLYVNWKFQQVIRSYFVCTYIHFSGILLEFHRRNLKVFSNKDSRVEVGQFSECDLSAIEVIITDFH